MFYFTEYFIRKSFSNGISLFIFTIVFLYYEFNEPIHSFSMVFFAISGLMWIYFGYKFKQQLNFIDEPVSETKEFRKYKIHRVVDSALSTVLVLTMIFNIAKPEYKSFYVLLTVVFFLFFTRLYQIVLISKYLKEAKRD